MKRWLLFLLLTLPVFLPAQTSVLPRSLEWPDQPDVVRRADGRTVSVWTFRGAGASDLHPALPVYTERVPVGSPVKVQARLRNPRFSPLPQGGFEGSGNVPADIEITAYLEQEGRQYFARINFIPLRKSGSGFEKLESFELELDLEPAQPGGVQDRGPFTYNSALGSGALYKFGVRQNGIYKLDYNFIKNELGVSDLDNIDPRRLRIYGNGANMLPEKTNAARPDDLIENAVFVSGEADGKFDAGDYILFYAVGPRPVNYRPVTLYPELTIRPNLYSSESWYFLKIADGQGLRIQEKANVPANYSTTEFDDVQRLEDDTDNLLDAFSESASGSGRRWFGDRFLQTRSRTYSFDFANVVTSVPGRIRAEFAGRSDVSTQLRMKADNTQFTTTVGYVTTEDNESSYAALAVLGGTFTADGDNVAVEIQYPQTAQPSEGWLDYIEVQVRRRLSMAGQTLIFRDVLTLSQDAATFTVENVAPNTTVWDITDPQAPQRQQTSVSGTTLTFGSLTKDVLRQFIAFADNTPFSKPEVKIGRIDNQNLHGLDNIDMAIVYPAELEAAAQQLAEHRKSFSGIQVAMARIDQVYNEFSSGNKDITAIRDFARMLYERKPDKFKYLLLFGDGTYDPRNLTASDENRDLIPVYETAESFNPVLAYPSDDYFGLLSDNEGDGLTGSLDIAVGRLPVHNPADASAVVDKIIDYDKNPTTLGDWRLRHLFLADDEDGNVHLAQADDLATKTQKSKDFFNIEKIYFDAYQQIATSGGDRFPDAKAAINADIFKGALVAQYIGHGGPRGWAQERVIDNTDIASWQNENRYPLIITATCSFGGYDDFKTLTGGEQSLLKTKSGAIGLFTTVRAVYVSGNELLTDNVQKVIFEKINGKYRTIGEILKDGKNPISGSLNVSNARRFTLLGDPAQYLGIPEYRVTTTAVKNAAGIPIDTLRALMPVIVEGMVTDTFNQLLSSFNGRVFVTIFDKSQTLQTLGQDDGSPVRPFRVQRSVLFRGSATVTNGRFSVKCNMPKDINYNWGHGKISYYAENGTVLDAAGADSSIVIGGNANLIQDDKPPVVQAFLNTDDFVFGGLTSESPKLLVKCADDYGMNVSGASLGHDLTAVLDGNALETIVLNDFYESVQDSANRGQAIYPLRNLTTGRHTLRVKGWDIANNPGEGYTEFVVAEDGKAALEHVLNYPNPFTTNTSFQFEHNLAGQLLDVQISIFSISGKLVKTILHSSASEGFRVTDIAWDGRDDYGDQLAKGVYVYRVKVRGTDENGNNASAESKFEKLVLLK